MSREERKEIAKKRLRNILSNHTVALTRTIEQKIADAGPYNQRINPHLITEARNELIEAGDLRAINRKGSAWYALSDTPEDQIEPRLAEQEPIHDAVGAQAFTRRMGQTLEISIFRSLAAQSNLEALGRFTDLDDHDDSQPYSKEEPPSGIGNRSIPGQKRLDFLVRHPDREVGWAGIEAKNTRQWLYPQRDEIKDLLAKCIHLDAVPVLVGRRIPYVTFHVLNPCGLIIWQTLRQRYPQADETLADQARNKRLLGYADIRLGNQPDGPLQSFLHEKLPSALPAARERFNEYQDLLRAYAIEDMSYEEFSARVRRRSQGVNEDHDWEDEDRRDEERDL